MRVPVRVLAATAQCASVRLRVRHGLAELVPAKRVCARHRRGRVCTARGAHAGLRVAGTKGASGTGTERRASAD